jgi:sec-independent protein translocase protein TatB
MFEVGFTEIVLILGLALLVLGPEKLPGLAEKVGRWTGRARAMARQLRTQLEHEVTLEELARSKPPHDSASASSNASANAPTPPPNTHGIHHETAAQREPEIGETQTSPADPHSSEASTTKPAQ